MTKTYYFYSTKDGWYFENNQYKFKAAVVGYGKEDIKIELDGEVLIVTGENKEEGQKQIKTIVPAGASLEPKDYAAEVKNGRVTITVAPETKKTQLISIF